MAKMPLLKIATLTSWLHQRTGPQTSRRNLAGSTSAVFPKPSAAWTMVWRPLSAFYAFLRLDARKISSTNVLERLNREICRCIGVVGIFPSADAYTRLLVTTYLMEYAEDRPASRVYLGEQILTQTAVFAYIARVTAQNIVL